MYDLGVAILGRRKNPIFTNGCARSVVQDVSQKAGISVRRGDIPGFRRFFSSLFWSSYPLFSCDFPLPG